MQLCHRGSRDLIASSHCCEFHSRPNYSLARPSQDMLFPTNKCSTRCATRLPFLLYFIIPIPDIFDKGEVLRARQKGRRLLACRSNESPNTKNFASTLITPTPPSYPSRNNRRIRETIAHPSIFVFIFQFRRDRTCWKPWNHRHSAPQSVLADT
jgi:hypothetical protein